MAPALLGAITIYLGLAATCELVQLYKMTNALLLIVQMTPILSLLLVDQRYDTREETDASGNLMILKPLENV